MNGCDERGWPTVEAFCADLAARVERRVGVMVDLVLEAMGESVDAYESLARDAADDVRDGVAETIRVFLATLAEARDVDGDERALLAALGARRAEQGVPLDSVRLAVRAAHAAGYDHLHIEAAALAAEHPERRVDLHAVSRHLTLHSQEFFAAQWGALRAGHVGVDRDREALAGSYFFDLVLSDSCGGDAEIRAAAAAAGFAIEAPCALLALVPANGDPRDLSARVRLLRPALPEPAVSPLRFDPYPHVVALVGLGKAGWRPLLTGVAERVADARLVVVAEPAASLDALGRLYRGCVRSLPVAARLQPRIVRAVDLGQMRAAGEFDDAERFLQVDTVLGETFGRRADWARMALDTLVALRNCRGDVTVAARELGVKETTVYSRLASIEDRSGLSLDNPRDLATLGWVISLYTFDPGSLPPLGDPRWGRRARITGRVPHVSTTRPAGVRT